MKISNTLYRGWWVLAGLFLVYAASNGILMHTLPIIYPALMDEFGWTATQVTTPASILFVIAAIASPPTGILLDRFSARRVILFGAIAMVAGLFAFSYISELWHMIAVYVVFALALSACGIVSTMLVLTRWFSHLRGRATGILLLASSLGASLFPLILGAGMNSFGWRGSLTIFAALAAILTILPALFLLKDRPVAGETDGPVSSVLAAVGPTFREAIRQPRYYLIAFATGSIWLTVISLLQHQPIYLARDLGVDTTTILPRVFSVFFAFSVVGKFGFGWLSDRLDKGFTLISSIFILTMSLFLLRSIDGENTLAIYTYAAMAGIGFSGSFTTIQIWIASFYAGPSYGKILASLTLFDTLSGALGTWVAGMMRDDMGSYLPVINLMIGICTLAAISIAIVRQFHKSKTPSEITTQ
jgi:OFA family oxalate/formate antiporter-like MFS transporter